MCDNPTKEPHTLKTQLLGADSVICGGGGGGGGGGKAFCLTFLIF